jgi:predicted ABC-type sugar transport system permease subunit
MPSNRGPLLPWIRMSAPAAFLGYGLYLVSRSLIVAVVVAVCVFLLCRFLLGLYTARVGGDEQSGDD